MLVAVRIQGVEADAVIERHRGQHRPLVLQIDAVGRSGLGPVVDNGERSIRRQGSGGVEHLRTGLGVGPVDLHDHAAAQLVRIRQPVDALQLDPARSVALLGELGDAGEQQVAWDVGLELQGRVAPEDRGLAGEMVAGELIAGDGVGGPFPLAVVKRVAEEVALSVHHQAHGVGRRARIVREIGMQAHPVGDLEGLLGCAEDQREATRLVDDVVEVSEGLHLVAGVVQRGRTAVR